MILDLSLSNKIFETDLLSAAMQELDIIFSTTNCELIGYPQFGTNFEQYLWALTPTLIDLKEYIINKISEMTFASKVRNHVEVEQINDGVEYAYYVKIYLYTDTDYAVKNFKINNTDLA